MEKKFIILFTLLVLLGACKHNKPSTNSELFQKYYRKNIDGCVAAMLKTGKDSLTAVKKCECMLNALYEIDSTFVRKEGEALDAFLKQYSEKIDSLCTEQ